MTKELSDSEVFGTQQQELSDADVFGKAKPTEPQQRTVLKSEDVQLPGYLKPFQNALQIVSPNNVLTPENALGLAEQPGAGAYGLLQQIYGGTKGLIKATAAKAAGLNFSDTFNEEYQAAHMDMPEYTPITPAGAKMTQTFSNLFTKVLGLLGDTVYEGVEKGNIPGVPLPVNLMYYASTTPEERQSAAEKAGALTQGLAGVTALLVGPKAGKGKGAAKPGAPAEVPPISADQAIANFKDQFPATANAIDASQVGKINIYPLDKSKPIETAQVRVADVATEALNKELNVPGVEELSLPDKLKLVVAKYAGAEGVPLADQIKYANAIGNRLARLAETQDAIIASRPRLPAPGGTVNTVTPAGTVMTSAQRAELAAQAEVYKQFQSWQKGKEDAAAAKAAEKQEKAEFNKRTGSIGYNRKFGKSQRGVFDIEGLDQNVPAVKAALESAASKGELLAYPLNQNESNFFKGMGFEQWEDFINSAPSVQFEGNTIKFLAKDFDAVKATSEAINLGQLKPSQRGMFDVEGVEQNLPKAQKAAEQLSTKGWTVSNPQESAQAAERAMNYNYKVVEDKKKLLTTNVLKQVRRAVVSHDYDLQADLAKAGPLGEQAMLRMNVEPNAGMMAKTRYDNTAKAIFDDLNSTELKSLEKIIRLRRIIQTDKVNGIGTIVHEVDPVTQKPVTGPMAKALMDQMEKGDPNFTKLDGKATALFAVEKTNLQRLLEEGLIDRSVFDKMSTLSQSRAERMEVIDPETLVTHSVDKQTKVRSSGIPLPSRSKAQVFNMDARTLLIEDIARVENRIAHNKTMLALQKLAEEVPDNGIVIALKGANKSPKAVPEGWTSFPLRREGKVEHILVQDDYAKQLMGRPDTGLNTPVFKVGSHDVTLGSILRTVSGSTLLKATATKYNPAFAVIAGLPMDILHTWVATRDVYSPHLPMFAGQMMKDMAVTAKDAFMRTGRWEQAMQEGMGPNFMTHEARANAEGIRSTVEPRLQKTRTALSFFGDWLDTWVRLAHRERLINQGASSADATAAAVARLNFYRGGMLTKWVETIWPYTNVTVNSASKVIENSAAAPKQALTKAVWIAGTATAVKLANMISSPETDKAISPEDKARAMQMTFGDQFYVLDADGNKRYFYVNMRLDQSVAPVNAAVVAGLEYAERGRVPTGLLKNMIGQVMPSMSSFIPSFQAYKAYMANYSAYKDHPIYSGPNVKPEDQYRTFGKSSPTNPLAVAAGQATGMSPMGLEEATKSLMNTNNFWLQAAGSGLKPLFQGMNPRDQAQTAIYALESVPGLKSVIKLTTPGNQMMKDMEEVDQQVNSKFKKQVDGLDELIFQVNAGQKSMREVEKYIQAQSPESQQVLQQHAKYTYAIDKVMKNYKASEGIPPRSWWLSSARIKDEARAQVFYNEYLSAKPEDRQRMWSIASGLQSAGVGYLSPSFKREFQKQVQLLGSDRR